jgi:hypothetical protein
MTSQLKWLIEGQCAVICTIWIIQITKVEVIHGIDRNHSLFIWISYIFKADGNKLTKKEMVVYRDHVYGIMTRAGIGMVGNAFDQLCILHKKTRCPIDGDDCINCFKHSHLRWCVLFTYSNSCPPSSMDWPGDVPIQRVWCKPGWLTL